MKMIKNRSNDESVWKSKTFSIDSHPLLKVYDLCTHAKLKGEIYICHIPEAEHGVTNTC